MSGRARMLALLCAALVFATAILAQSGADRVRAEALADEIMYLPNAKLLTHFTAGMSSVIADVLWLRCVQLIGYQIQGARDFNWLIRMLDTVVRLDPYFVDAYRYGGIFLSALKADDDAGLDLLERGIVARPGSYQLSYEAAMVFLLNRREEAGSKRRAAHYLALSAATGKAPRFVAEVAAKLQGDFNLVEIEQEMWASLLQSEDKLLRDMAQRKLIELQLRETCRILNQRMEIFIQRNGRPASTLDELVKAGYTNGLPPELLQDPLGGAFVVTPLGVVQNTTLLNETATQILNALRAAIDQYREGHGEWPPSLDALIGAGTFDAIPAHPYEGASWVYNPETGEVR